MIKSIKYIFKEHFSNIYRIFCISRYELISDVRDTKFGLLWNFISPAIQVLTYYIVFGLGLKRGDQQGITYMPWLVVGFAIWWFISPCITQGCNAIYAKRNVITKIKFPVSILPTTICLKEFFNHLFMLVIACMVLFFYGFYPTLNWLWLLYYMLCAFVFVQCLALTTSVLNMITRDVKKLITSLMRMLLYMSPVLWSATYSNPILDTISMANPIFYIVNGYRESIFFGKTPFDNPMYTLYFWGVMLVLFVLGSTLMYKFKNKFIDLI